MLGLGSSRIKVRRPSLFELIQDRHQRFSLYSDSPWSFVDEEVDDALPISPSFNFDNSFFSVQSQPSPSKSPAMAPPKKERKPADAGEEHYGSVFSISGPVIVAENMIGVAMYELVCVEAPRSLRCGLFHAQLPVVQSWPRPVGWRSH